jgi:prophage antirepressor-like protein
MKKNTGTTSTTEVRDIVKFQFPATIQTTAKELTAITDQDGNPWFVAKEVCEVLGFDRATDATKYLDADEQTVIRNHSLTSSRNPNVTIINEPGLYSLILRSRKPEAKAFKRWVTHEVLPTIRETGAYTAQPEMTTEQKIQNLVLDVIELNQWLNAAQPKVDYYDTFATLKGSSTLSLVAKHLGWGPYKFRAKLRQEGILFERGGINLPAPLYVEKKFFEKSTGSNGYGSARRQARVTAKGILFLAGLYGKKSAKQKPELRLVK